MMRVIVLLPFFASLSCHTGAVGLLDLLSGSVAKQVGHYLGNKDVGDFLVGAVTRRVTEYVEGEVDGVEGEVGGVEGEEGGGRPAAGRALEERPQQGPGEGAGLKEEEEDEEGLDMLESLNWSISGNTDFAETFYVGLDVGRSLRSGLGSLVDLGMVGRVVDLVMERVAGGGRVQRSSGEESVKSVVTTVVGALLGQQRCWERSACRLGELTQPLPGASTSLSLSICNILKQPKHYICRSRHHVRLTGPILGPNIQQGEVSS